MKSVRCNNKKTNQHNIKFSTTNQKTHNSTPAKYNNSHIYCNYKQVPFTLDFFSQLHVLTFVSYVHLHFQSAYTDEKGGGGSLLNKVVQDIKENKKCLSCLYESHVKYFSLQALLSSGTVLKSAHGLFNTRQLHILLYNGNFNNDAFHTFNIKQGKPIQKAQDSHIDIIFKKKRRYLYLHVRQSFTFNSFSKRKISWNMIRYQMAHPWWHWAEESFKKNLMN